MPGRDLMERAAGTAPGTGRSAMFGEIYTHDAQHLDAMAPTVTHQWAQQRDGKLIAPTDPGETPELYHLVQDPMEHTNLARSHPDWVEALRAALAEWPYAAAALD